MAEAESWAATIEGPAYAIDDETAIQVTDGEVEVVSEGQWRLFPRSGPVLRCHAGVHHASHLEVVITEFLTVDDGTIAYDVTGSGPLVVLAHGLGDSRAAYRFLVPQLAAAGYRVAAVDLRGCGESSADWPAFTRTDIAGGPDRARPAPRGARRAGRALDLGRRGHHRGGTGARAGPGHRRDRPVHPQAVLQPGRPARQAIPHWARPGWG